MKVLILHQHFKTPDTGGAIRSYYLAKALVDHGVAVSVITAHNKKSLTKNIEGIEVQYLRVPYDNRFGFLRRGYAFLSFLMKSVKASHEISSFDLCYAISVPLTVGIAAMWIKKKFKVPYIFEVGDLWPDAPIQLGVIRNSLFKSLLYSLEKKIYRNASSVVALSPAIRDIIEKKVPGMIVHLLPNMADCDFYRPSEKDSELEARFGVKDKFVIVYAGAMGIANGLDHVVNCAHECSKSNLPVHFLLCGDGAEREKLINLAVAKKLSNLTVLPFCNRDGVREVMNVADAVFICYKKVPILETGSPNKYFDGLAAGKLIIINFGGWIRDDIEQNNCGIWMDPESPGDLVKKIRQFIEGRSLLQAYQRASRLLGENEYSRIKQSAAFLDLMGL